MRAKRLTRWLVLSALGLVLASSAGADSLGSSQEVLRQAVERLEVEGAFDFGDTRLAATRLIPVLYERLGFQLAWTRSEMLEELLSAVRGAAGHGLDPRDYHLAAIESRLARGDWESVDPAVRVDLDLLLTDSLARLVFTLHFGKLNPTQLDPEWNLSRTFEGIDAVKLFEDVLRSGEIQQVVDQAAPQGAYYSRLLPALAEYRAIEAAGGWPIVEDGPALELDVVDSRVPTLRRRLVAVGDLDAGPEDSAERYDKTLEAAVIAFQTRHGIDSDGIVGTQTLGELNVPVEHRVDQLRASLERARWVFRDLVDDLLVVDIAGFELHLFRQGAEIWTTPVQVGLPYHSTPIFKSQMTYLVFNPTWTVPPGILRRETLPKVRKDPTYLATENMSVVAASGQLIDPDTLDLDGPFPYTIRQEPGPNNALGRVKFMFPNPYMVYLHDTPSKTLFGKASRAFSHGCIRAQDPLRLAEILLEASPEWDEAAIERTLASNKTTTVLLAEPLTVMLLYWTAEVSEDGTVVFKKDIYNRDAAVIRGLNDPFEFSPPHDLPEDLVGR